MRALGLLCTTVTVASLVVGCSSSEKQWYKAGQEYTVAEFKRDRAACEKNGTLDEDCLRQRGWVPLTADKEKAQPTVTPQKGRYY